VQPINLSIRKTKVHIFIHEKDAHQTNNLIQIKLFMERYSTSGLRVTTKIIFLCLNFANRSSETLPQAQQASANST
jgi:hypothetical protein